VKELDRVRKEEAELERKLATLRARRERLVGAKVRSESGTTRPIRDVTLDLLLEAKTPLNSLLVAAVIKPLLGRDVPSTRFGTLSTDEQKSWESKRARPVYLCHCLTHDQGQAMKRFWARSDWPLQDRIIGPMTGRILFLKGAAWTIELAQDGEGRAVDWERLKFVAADQARDAGLLVKRGEFPYAPWLDAIRAGIRKFAAEDEEIRSRAAIILGERLTEKERLFGSRGGFVSLPGSAEGWRSGTQ
jgi:hypothetical protein